MNVRQYENDIIDMYCNQNLNTVQISKIIGCSDTSIGKILNKNGIKRIHKPNEIKVSYDEIEDICNRYINGETTEQIAKLYNICGTSVAKIIRNNNIEIRPAKRYSKVKIHDYFETIDRIDKAYFLGWMISDGAIIEQKTRINRSKIISLEIHKKDIHILEMFADAINADKSIIKTNEKRGHSYIRFSSEKMASDLAKYGVVPRKSKTSYLPKISDEMMPHMIHGIFDGDGTVTIDKHNSIHFGFYGSKEICEDISCFLNNKLGLNKNKVSKSTCYHVWYGGNNISKKMRDFLYKDCGKYYLKRKYIKFYNN